MVIKLDNISMELNHSENDLRAKVAKKLRRDDFNYEIFKKSIDSRKKNNIKIIYSLVVYVDGAIKGYKSFKKPKYELVKKDFGFRPVIVGFGPSGMFSALLLAMSGAKPIVLERGQKVEDRIKTVEKFWNEGVLNMNSNIQFGEGGAGTFSDGKLSTGVKDKFARKSFILNEFVLAGADPSVKYLNKPHLGTDYLVKIVKNIREKIISLGGEIHFDKTVTDINIEDNEVKGVYVGEEYFESKKIIFATGHSSRDTFEMLLKKGINMEPKPFAVGLRVEHLQDDINKAQYGRAELSDHLLTADYKLTYRTGESRSVYSFCMCPGGYVVNSSSEENMLCVNGMSNYKRNSKNANSAIVVGVGVDDWKEKFGDGILSGLKFQRELERKAFELGGSDYSMPLQTFGDYKLKKASDGFGKIKPVNKGKYVFADLNQIFPELINESIKEGMENFGKKIAGFNIDDALLTGVESRTSSPIRVLRNENLASNYKGLYFSGEGAGYAGGIMSAAIDGMKIAEKIIEEA